MSSVNLHSSALRTGIGCCFRMLDWSSVVQCVLLIWYKLQCRFNTRLDGGASSVFVKCIFKLIPEPKLVPVLDKLLYICKAGETASSAV